MPNSPEEVKKYTDADMREAISQVHLAWLHRFKHIEVVRRVELVDVNMNILDTVYTHDRIRVTVR